MPKQLKGTHPGKQGTHRIVPTDEDLIKIRDLAADGKSQKSIAVHIGISADLFFKWMQRHKEVRLAWEEGMGHNDAELTSVVMGAVRKDGHRMQIPAAMFLMKVKHGYSEKQHIEVEQSSKATTKFEVQDISPPDEQ